MGKYDDVAERLRARLAELTGRAEAIEGELQHELEADSAEQAIDLADDDALAGIDLVLRREIADIEAALRRIADGEYGTCANCGEEISAGRLEALPAARLCIACA